MLTRGLLFALMLSVLFGTWQYAKAAHYESDLNSLKASYATAALKATQDAEAQEAKDTAAIKSQSAQAISQAQSAASKASQAKAAYDEQLAKLAKTQPKDLPHLCASVQVPAELIP